MLRETIQRVPADWLGGVRFGGGVTLFHALVGADIQTTIELRVLNDPFGDGWLFAVSLGDVFELDTLLDAKTYEASLEE